MVRKGGNLNLNKNHNKFVPLHQNNIIKVYNRYVMCHREVIS